MTGLDDATGLLGTAVGLGATLFFTSMLLDHVDKTTNKLIKSGTKKRTKKSSRKQPNPFSIKY